MPDDPNMQGSIAALCANIGGVIAPSETWVQSCPATTMMSPELMSLPMGLAPRGCAAWVSRFVLQAS